MKRLIFLFVLLLFCAVCFAQTVTLTFTGRDTNNNFVKLDRVVVENATQNWQETIVYPDTILSMGNVGIGDFDMANAFVLLQNNPNPFDGITYAALQTMKTGEVLLRLADVNGRTVEMLHVTTLQPGTHHFRIQVANAGTYLLTARQNGRTSSIKIINNGQGAANKIEYVGNADTKIGASFPMKSTKGKTDKPFAEGDEMAYTGYAMVNGTEYQSEVIRQKQTTSEDFELRFTIETSVALPVVSTDPVTDIAELTATCGGNVTADGGDIVVARGVCWSTVQNPTVSDAHTTDGSGTGAFTSTLTGLTAGTTYYVRAYATNSAGTAYGEEVNFTTAKYTLPVVTTAAVTDVKYTTAVCGGNVTDDGGTSIYMRGVCYSTSANPTVSDTKVITKGTVGEFSCNLIDLSSGTTYYVRAFATNAVGTAYGEEVIFTTEEKVFGKSCPGVETVTDHEGNVYKTVQIGDQCWMKENMRCTTAPSTGTTILEKVPNGVSYSGKKAYYVNGSADNTATYGLLYNWFAAMDTFDTKYGETSASADYEACPFMDFSGNRRGICPKGWHLPSKADWITLTDYVSSQKEYVNCDTNICIAPALASTEGWLNSPYEGAVGYSPSLNNATGFSAVPGGFYGLYGFEAMGYLSYLWTATQEDNLYVDMFILNKSYSFVEIGPDFKSNGSSVRCVKD